MPPNGAFLLPLSPPSLFLSHFSPRHILQPCTDDMYSLLAFRVYFYLKSAFPRMNAAHKCGMPLWCRRLRGGVGLTTAVFFKYKFLEAFGLLEFFQPFLFFWWYSKLHSHHSDDEDASLPLTRRVFTLNLIRRSSTLSIPPFPIHKITTCLWYYPKLLTNMYIRRIWEIWETIDFPKFHSFLINSRNWDSHTKHVPKELFAWYILLKLICIYSCTFLNFFFEPTGTVTFLRKR